MFRELDQLSILVNFRRSEQLQVTQSLRGRAYFVVLVAMRDCEG